MSTQESAEPDPDELLPESSGSSEPSQDAVLDVSIQQHFNQIQLFFPSLIEVIGRVADSHPELAHKIVDNVNNQGEHRQEMEGIVIAATIGVRLNHNCCLGPLQ